MRNKLGFTLVELLAVVVILTLLSGLSIGYYKRSVEQSRFSQGLNAASNLQEAAQRFVDETAIEGIVYDFSKALTADMLDVQLPPNSFFQFVIVKGGDDGPEVYAYRGTAESHTYFIRVTPKKVICKGSDGNLTFCQSLGYTACDKNGGCTKP